MVDEATQKQMMAYAYKKQEEWKVGVVFVFFFVSPLLLLVLLLPDFMFFSCVAC